MNRKTPTPTLSKTLWCKIRCWQRLNNIDDDRLAGYLTIKARTLREYDANAGNISLNKIETFLSATGLEIEDLIHF